MQIKAELNSKGNLWEITGIDDYDREHDLGYVILQVHEHNDHQKYAQYEGWIDRRSVAWNVTDGDYGIASMEQWFAQHRPNDELTIKL